MTYPEIFKKDGKSCETSYIILEGTQIMRGFKDHMGNQDQMNDNEKDKEERREKAKVRNVKNQEKDKVKRGQGQNDRNKLKLEVKVKGKVMTKEQDPPSLNISF